MWNEHGVFYVKSLVPIISSSSPSIPIIYNRHIIGMDGLWSIFYKYLSEFEKI